MCTEYVNSWEAYARVVVGKEEFRVAFFFFFS